MALYAFDGTGNEDEDAPELNTNVVHFRDLYRGPVEYREGVGTRFSAFGRVMGSLFGFGGRSRIEELYEAACKNFERGDTTIDIIGFSRGAALAVHFSHILAEKGLNVANGGRVKPAIRFLGLWDTVGSFGLAINIESVINFQDIDLGWSIDDIPPNVQICAHAMALDERRETFMNKRYNIGNSIPKITELWFRGVHSDVGGGNGNVARNAIALSWMLEQARNAGLPIDLEALGHWTSQADPHARIYTNTDPQIDDRRREHPGDRYHDSAKSRSLQPGDEATFTVHSEDKYNWSGIKLSAGATYHFDVPDSEVWKDGGISCSADGWSSNAVPWYKEAAIRRFEQFRRLPAANWFELIGALSNDDKDLFRIGRGGPARDYTAPRDAELFTFANDLSNRYRNNVGSIRISITRLT